MKCSRPTGLVIVLVTLPIAVHLASLETTSRSPPEHGDVHKRFTKKLVNVNTSSIDILDVRTPPKFKVQQKNKPKPSEEFENSHAGVAIPVDADTLELEATTKKLNFYKYERPTTNSGLSTWILLSGQSSTLKPTTKKPVIKPILEGKDNEQPKETATLVVDTKPNRIVKPIFKKKVPSTTTTTTTTTTSTTTTTTTTQRPVASTSPKSNKEITKLTKIKASELNNALNKKNNTTSSTTTSVTSVTTTKPPTAAVATTTSPSNTISLDTKNRNSTTITSSSLPVEAKNQEVEIEASSEAKKKPATTKRKKNKTRRKKPEKAGTTVAKPTKNKNSAISTQIYSYLAKEIMPTVGAGLVGLMVTAGLATYFLYPFGAARRADTISDRRDKDANYYFSDDYSSGMPEEEAIGKVIAGMPINTLLSNNYKSPSNRKNYPVNTGKYRIADTRANVQPQKYERFVKGSVENVPLGPDDYQAYKNNDDRKFVVGSVPKEVEEVTPVTVPEHGPRNLKLQKISSSDTVLAPAYGPRNLRRRRRDLSEDFTEDPGKFDPVRRFQRSGISNELDSEDLPPDVDKINEETKTEKEITTVASSPTTVTEVPHETTTVSTTETVQNFFDNVKYVLFLKARLALEVLRNATTFFSSYISNVQNKVEDNYRNFIRRYESAS